MKAKKVQVCFIRDIIGSVLGTPGSTFVQTYLYLPDEDLGATVLEDRVLIIKPFKVPKVAKVRTVKIADDVALALRRLYKVTETKIVKITDDVVSASNNTHEDNELVISAIENLS